MPTAAAGSFAVLKQSGPAPPAEVRLAFEASRYRSAFAPNTDLAKPIGGRSPLTGTRSWLVPGDDALCMYVPDTEGAAMTCRTLEEAAVRRAAPARARADPPAGGLTHPAGASARHTPAGDAARPRRPRRGRGRRARR